MTTSPTPTYRNRDGDLTVAALRSGMAEIHAIRTADLVRLTRLSWLEHLHRFVVTTTTANNADEIILGYRETFTDIRRARRAFRKQASK